MKISENDKFAPHTNAEASWAIEMHKINDTLKAAGLNLQRGVRLGRQVKAYNSTGVGVYHLYLWNDGTWELWINGHHCDWITTQTVLDYVKKVQGQVNSSSRRNRWTKEARKLFTGVSL